MKNILDWQPQMFNLVLRDGHSEIAKLFALRPFGYTGIRVVIQSPNMRGLLNCHA